MNTPIDSSCTAVLSDVVAGGCALSVAEGRLRLTGPTSAVNEVRQSVVERREDLLAQLASRQAAPASGIQRRLWFLQQLDPSGTGYTFSFVHRLTGALDPGRLERAVNAVVAAQPGLRAGFLDGTGSPVQLVEDNITVPLTVLPRAAAPSAGAREKEAREGSGNGEDGALARLRAELVRPFDLAHPPLLRTALLPQGDDEWLWGVTYHHLISDGWTHGRFLNGVSDAYRTDGPAPRPEADYSEYVTLDITQARDDPRRKANLEHWKDRLAGVQSGEVPADRPRPALRTHHGGRTDDRLDAETTRRLRELAVQERTTLFSVLLAVHATVLAAHTGQDQAIVGTPHANRPGERFHDTAGCFVSTLALPVDLSGAPPSGSSSPAPPRRRPPPGTTATTPTSSWWRNWPRSGTPAATRCSRPSSPCRTRHPAWSCRTSLPGPYRSTPVSPSSSWSSTSPRPTTVPSGSRCSTTAICTPTRRRTGCCGAGGRPPNGSRHTPRSPCTACPC